MKGSEDARGEAQENREIASQMQAMEAVSQAEREEEEMSKRATIDEGENTTKNKTLTETWSNAASSVQEEKVEMSHATSSSSTFASKETSLCKKNDKETVEEECSSVTEALQQIVGSDWSELDETVRSNIARAVQDCFKPY